MGAVKRWVMMPGLTGWPTGETQRRWKRVERPGPASGCSPGRDQGALVGDRFGDDDGDGQGEAVVLEVEVAAVLDLQ
ncbi:hypothetical protein AB0C13_34160, partial [Streptomyces sp. NPDC049099]|uniref:hypothetical protein n=1 Tax=Streptomyces sp. NPDC049099 TaxID=3155768 RepID=UPI00341FF0F2